MIWVPGVNKITEWEKGSGRRGFPRSNRKDDMLVLERTGVKSGQAAAPVR